MDWLKLLENLSLFAIGSGMLAWLARSLFTIWINKDFEKFKHQLTKEQIKYTKLQEKRGQVIEDIYNALDDFEAKMKSLLNPLQPANEPRRTEKLKIADNAGQKFIECYRKNKIYFSKETIKILERTEELFHTAMKSFTKFPVEDFDEEFSKKRSESRWNAFYTVLLDIPKPREQLEDQFRKLLGAENT